MKTTNHIVNEDLSALVAKAKTGDQAAFTELYDRTAPELYRCIRAMTRDEDLTWDIQQDAYLKAYQSLNTLENNDVFFPWLRRIAVNGTVSHMRKQRALTFTELAADEDDDATPELPDLNVENQPELSLDRKETSRLVQEILSKLPEEQQLIVGMHYYDELSVKEIAETLKLSTGAVKAQLFHGRKKVETAVRALEKQGVKLYGLSPVAFLMALMRRAEPTAVETAKQAAVKAVVTKGSVDAVAAAAVPVAAKTFGQVLAGRLLAGTLAVALIGGGIWGGAKLLKSNNTDAPYQPTTAETTERLAGADTAEGLTETVENRPVVTEPVPTEPTEATVNPDWPSGSCGDNLSWYFNPDTGLLTIEGSGAMDDAVASTDKVGSYDSPWERFDEEIRSVSLPDGLTSIGRHCFQGCYSLSELTIPEGVTEIGTCAFETCDTLNSVTIPNSVTTIGSRAFSVTALTNVTIPGSVSKIDGAFGECDALTSVTISEGVTDIGQSAFYGCRSLTSVTIPNSVTSIGEKAFSRCDMMTIVVIPDSVTSIGEYAFGYLDPYSGSEKVEGFTIIGVTGSAAERYANENGFSFVDSNAVSTTGLDVIFERMAQDEADRTGLDGSWSRELGAVTKVSTILQINGRFLAKVVRAAALTATEVELAQAKQTGTITLNGQEYRYTESQTQFNEWMGWSEGYFSIEELGGRVVVIETQHGHDYYGVYQAGDVYLFAKEVGGVTTRIETVVNEDWVSLDGTTPVVLGPGGSVSSSDSLETYLQNHSIASHTICRLGRSEDGKVYLYVDMR